MVLWEITLGTAYFLGLKRTYKLALKIQRKLISPKHPKVREFVQRRTRNVFDVALRVHLAIQERDIEVGRNLGNRILRWLDRMKPEAHIRKPPAPPTAANIEKQHPNHLRKQDAKKGIRDEESNRHLFAVARSKWPKPFPTMMMRPIGNNIQHRRYSSGGFPVNNTNFGFGEVLRHDIKQWILLDH